MFLLYNTGTYARHLARQLNITSIFPNNQRQTRRKGYMDVIVNWGCGPKVVVGLKLPGSAQILNQDIGGSVRKMRTFELLDKHDLPHPRVTRDALSSTDGVPFYMRGKYLGRIDGLSGGQGITVYEKGQRPTEKHDFYSQVVAKAYEFRIHVANGQIICEQIKYVPPQSNVLIRNYDNGARFSNRSMNSVTDSDVADRGREIAVRAISAVGLEFGAVDMSLTRNGSWVVFETNSAPGLMEWEDAAEHDMPSTFQAYLDFFRGFVRSGYAVR